MNKSTNKFVLTCDNIDKVTIESKVWKGVCIFEVVNTLVYLQKWTPKNLGWGKSKNSKVTWNPMKAYFDKLEIEKLCSIIDL